MALKLNVMKIFLFMVAMAITFNFNSNLASSSTMSVGAVNNAAVSSLQKDTHGGGTIIMDDLVTLVANSQDPIDPVVGIEVFNNASQPIYKVTGCFKQICSYDLSSLNSGTYYTEATTKKGEKFGATVTVKK